VIGSRGYRTVLAAAAAALAGAGAAEAETLREVFRRVNPTVVVVRTRDFPDPLRGGAAAAGVGSGVLISAGGQVMTAAHVVHTADEIVVEFLSGERAGARVVASEPEADVSLLQLDRVPPGAVVARLGDSDGVEVGDPVFIVGAPYGIGHTLSVGHISARHRPNTVYSAMSQAEFLQTDAAINQGNSGGPMFSMAGEVIGIVSHNISRGGGSEGLGFVVTSNMARRLLLEQRQFWTGLAGVVLTGELARALHLPQPVGLLVQRVARGSPAEAMGLRAGTLAATVEGRSMLLGGDVILAVDGVRLDEPASYERIQERLRAKRPGERTAVQVLRDGRLVELSAALPDQP
jgi:S1-C subfamily serine protease